MEDVNIGQFKASKNYFNLNIALKYNLKTRYIMLYT